MSENDGTYAALMKLQQRKPNRKRRAENPPPPQDPGTPKLPETQRTQLPAELENVSKVGYVSHSFRLTTDEKEWLDSFCFRLSAKLDRKITHNALVRVLLRIADNTMKKRPDNNELLDKLLQIKD